MNTAFAFTLTQNAVFEPTCTTSTTHSAEATGGRHSSSELDTRDPFYSSAAPQLYIIGCTTVISYILVIILLITPRTFYVGAPGGRGGNFLGRHGVIAGSYGGNSSVVGVGGRPWLQKVAAILVAISLTIATVDSFEEAQHQYEYGYSDASSLAQTVINGTELRIMRVISSTFLWLAQVQTLIRLFPRHKEKITIKWAGFALIILDTVFSCLDNFMIGSDSTHPRLYDDAIPALSYLFELALNLLYAAWVVFYAICKHRYAFFHPKMRNICLVAFVSLVSVLIPVVFFVLDIAKPGVAGWGNYVRWVGSAAASVVVWEWVERIEALERDEKKDGILGREIFDGDEMLEVTPSEEVNWPRQTYSSGRNGGGGGAATIMHSGRRRTVKGLTHRPLRARVGFHHHHHHHGDNRRGRPVDSSSAESQQQVLPTPPPVVFSTTPVSRTDTTSASTVYNVHYHPVSTPSLISATPQAGEADVQWPKEQHVEEEEEEGEDEIHPNGPSTTDVHVGNQWRTLLNPLRSGHLSPPREVAFAQAEEQEHSSIRESSEDEDDRWEQEQEDGIRSLNRLRVSSGRRRRRQRQRDRDLPVTVIPARRQDQQAWTPQWYDDSSSRQSRPRHQSLSPRQRQRGSGDHHLTVNVIPSQTRASAPWAIPENSHGMASELRYDPESAALVSPGFDPPLRPLNSSSLSSQRPISDHHSNSLTIDDASEGSTR